MEKCGSEFWCGVTQSVTAGRLFKQFIIDTWAATEQSRLRYLRTHQRQLYSELYNQVVDAFTRVDSES